MACTCIIKQVLRIEVNNCGDEYSVGDLIGLRLDCDISYFGEIVSFSNNSVTIKGEWNGYMDETEIKFDEIKEWW